jgi:hypothetical protein
MANSREMEGEVGDWKYGRRSPVGVVAVVILTVTFGTPSHPYYSSLIQMYH